ncbi:hypothetical protein JHD48_07720 [Sulfurimonas sp. SAG-AH-194-I05]|nr:hypothetical protein [Sulfurimonas sp. SAG-AH-194-I05]MDF1875620.1 hypothetical protein [Sulfurimonas sp. SAG-AH-194-I05]
MKRKKLVSLVVLFVLSFSVVHEYAFAYFDDNHCTAVEYVSELETPSNHGDICDIHFEYHQSFVLQQLPHLSLFQKDSLSLLSDKETYTFETKLLFFKPPRV